MWVDWRRCDYVGAIEEKRRSETITSVLYPNDNQYRGEARMRSTPSSRFPHRLTSVQSTAMPCSAGRELRLKQQYFFSCATIQDILRRYKKHGLPLSQLPTKVRTSCCC